MTQSSARQPEDTVKTNVFTQFPPIIPMVVIGVVLVSMAQFGSTERLAAAFAWLIFIAVLLADAGGAFVKLNKRIALKKDVNAPLPPGSDTI